MLVATRVVEVRKALQGAGNSALIVRLLGESLIVRLAVLVEVIIML